LILRDIARSQSNRIVQQIETDSITYQIRAVTGTKSLQHTEQGRMRQRHR
jgi:hypothetical protein